MLTHLNFVMPYWESADMLREQVRHWLAWPEPARTATTFIVVDDCSARHPIDGDFLKAQPLDVRAFRITRKAAWNWRAAKNIAMHEAPEGWSLVTDIDHALPSDQAQWLFEHELDPTRAYFFTRRNASDGASYKRHSSTRLLTRKMFWEIGGYDESFVGTQMGWKGEYPARVEKVAGAMQMLPVHLLRYDSSVIADATAKLPRRDDSAATRKSEMAAVDRIRATWSGVQTMTFPYERVV